MNLHEYIGKNLKGKSIVLVGNAKFKNNKSELIDGHDEVVRFNLFKKEWFEKGRCGTRTTQLCVNLDRSRRDASARDALCRWVKEHCPEVPVLTPYVNDRHDRLPALQSYYADRSSPLFFPELELPHPLKLDPQQHPSTGFYMAWHLLHQGIPVTIIGYTGTPSCWHDGAQEVRVLQNHELVSFHRMNLSGSKLD